MIKLFRVLVPVADIERACDFYETVLGIPGKRISPGRHYFDCGGTILACYDPAADGDGYSATPIPEPIYLSVDNLDEVFERAAAAGAEFPSAVVPGVGPLGKISVRPWGERSFYASDPFGNPLCFVSTESVFTG